VRLYLEISKSWTHAWGCKAVNKVLHQIIQNCTPLKMLRCLIALYLRRLIPMSRRLEKKMLLLVITNTRRIMSWLVNCWKKIHPYQTQMVCYLLFIIAKVVSRDRKFEKDVHFRWIEQEQIVYVPIILPSLSYKRKESDLKCKHCNLMQHRKQSDVSPVVVVFLDSLAKSSQRVHLHSYKRENQLKNFAADLYMAPTIWCKHTTHFVTSKSYSIFELE